MRKTDQIRAKAFTGRTRRRRTSRRVRIADLLSRAFITVGGIGTIVAVLGVCLFLVWVVLPLFMPADVSTPKPVITQWNGTVPLHVAADEYQSMGWVLLSSGKIQVFRLDNGEVRHEEQLVEEGRLSSASFLVDGDEAVLGMTDGTIRLVRIGFHTTFLGEDQVDRAVQDQMKGEGQGKAVNLDDGVVELTPEDQLRHQRLRIEPITTKKVSDHPIRLIDHIIRPGGLLVCVLAGSDGALEMKAISGKEKEDFLSGETTFRLTRPMDLPYAALSPEAPRYLAIAGGGTNVYVAWEDGRLLRVNSTSLKKAFVAEKGRLTRPGTTLTAMGFTLGDNTLLWGDSDGSVHGGFPVRKNDLKGQGLYNVDRDEERSQYAFAITKELVEKGPKLLSLSPSGRSRIVICGFAHGEVR
ncbi:hypothetical protein ACFLU6_14405, partial [Acidobacteriota bacterium]